jgi:hypothetical protein
MKFAVFSLLLLGLSATFAGHPTEGKIGINGVEGHPRTGHLPVHPSTRVPSIFVRIAHASMGRGPVDVYIDGDKVFALADVKYGQVSEYTEIGYFRVASTFSLEVREKVGFHLDQEKVLNITSVAWSDSTFYTIVVSPNTENSRPMVSVLTDSPPRQRPNKLELNLVNLSPDSFPLTLYTKFGKPIAMNVEYLNKSEYYHVDSYQKDYFVSAASDPVNLHPLARVQSYYFKPGFRYSIFVFGHVQESVMYPLQLIVNDELQGWVKLMKWQKFVRSSK